jgi:hypothetical protein
MGSLLRHGEKPKLSFAITSLQEITQNMICHCYSYYKKKAIPITGCGDP